MDKKLILRTDPIEFDKEYSCDEINVTHIQNDFECVILSENVFYNWYEYEFNQIYEVTDGYAERILFHEGADFYYVKRVYEDESYILKLYKFNSIDLTDTAVLTLYNLGAELYERSKVCFTYYFCETGGRERRYCFAYLIQKDGQEGYIQIAVKYDLSKSIATEIIFDGEHIDLYNSTIKRTGMYIYRRKDEHGTVISEQTFNAYLICGGVDESNNSCLVSLENCVEDEYSVAGIRDWSDSTENVEYYPVSLFLDDSNDSTVGLLYYYNDSYFGFENYKMDLQKSGADRLVYLGELYPFDSDLNYIFDGIRISEEVKSTPGIPAVNSEGKKSHFIFNNSNALMFTEAYLYELLIYDRNDDMLVADWGFIDPVAKMKAIRVPNTDIIKFSFTTTKGDVIEKEYTTTELNLTGYSLQSFAEEPDIVIGEEYDTETIWDDEYLSINEFVGKVTKKTLSKARIKQIFGLIKDNYVSKAEGVEVESLEVDSFPLLDSANLVTSGGVYDALDSFFGYVSEELELKQQKEEGKSLVEDTLISKLENIEDDAQVNIIEVVKVGDIVLEVEDKTVTIPIAMSETPGVVRSSDAENGVTVNSDGTMTVNSISTDKIVQDPNSELILHGGDSNTQS